MDKLKDEIKFLDSLKKNEDKFYKDYVYIKESFIRSSLYDVQYQINQMYSQLYNYRNWYITTSIPSTNPLYYGSIQTISGDEEE